MTEVERLRDKALVALLRHFAVEVREKLPETCEELVALSYDLSRASEKQYDHDRNGARRAMGKADCAVADTEDSPHPPIPTAGEARAAADVPDACAECHAPYSPTPVSGDACLDCAIGKKKREMLAL